MVEQHNKVAENRAPGVPSVRPADNIEDVIIDEIFEPDPANCDFIGQFASPRSREVYDVVDGKVVENQATEESPANGKRVPTANEKMVGVAQMVTGATLAAIGIPTMILPGVPSTLMIAGGWTLAARGQRAFSGREITKFEEKTEVVTEVIKKETKTVTGGLLTKLGQWCETGSSKLDELDIDKAFGD